MFQLMLSRPYRINASLKVPIKKISHPDRQLGADPIYHPSYPNNEMSAGRYRESLASYKSYRARQRTETCRSYPPSDVRGRLIKPTVHHKERHKWLLVRRRLDQRSWGLGLQDGQRGAIHIVLRSKKELFIDAALTQVALSDRRRETLRKRINTLRSSVRIPERPIAAGVGGIKSYPNSVRSACLVSHDSDLIVIDMRIVSQGNHERFDIVSLPCDDIVR